MKLFGIKEWYRNKTGATRVRTDYVQRWLEELATKDPDFKYFQTEDEFYVADEAQLERLWNFLEERKAAERVVSEPPTAVDETTSNRIAQLEDLVLEQDARIDQLHKALQELILIYEALRHATSDPKAMPAAPKLPARYKWRILIVGGDHRTLARVEPLFNNVKFLHIESGGAAGDRDARRKMTYPRADAVFLMTSFMGHGLEAGVWNAYPKDIISRITGSTSSLESAIHVWIAAQEKAEEQIAKAK